MSDDKTTTRNSLVELLIQLIPEHTNLTYLFEVNREIHFEDDNGKIFRVSVEAWHRDAALRETVLTPDPFPMPITSPPVRLRFDGNRWVQEDDEDAAPPWE